MNPESITSLIRRRRTIKPPQFAEREVDESVVREILDNANWAPTHGMTQPWRFAVYVGASRSELAEFLAETYRQITPADSFREKKYQGVRTNVLSSPVVIAIGMKRQETGKISELDELLAVACAVQNMHLTATAHGLGAFWSTNPATLSEPFRDHQGLGPDDRALGLFFVGYPAVDWPEGNRQPTESRVRWIVE